MARNKGRRPADAPRPTPDSRPAAGGGADGPPAGMANGTAGASAGGAGRTTASGSAWPAPAARQAAAAGGPPERSGPGAPPSAAPPGRPGAPPSGAPPARPGAPPPGAGGPGGRPPGSGRTPTGTPPPRNGAGHSFRNGLIGGVIGGAVVALAVAYLLRPDASAELEALRAQMQQVAGSVAGLEGGAATVAALTSRLETLEQAAPPEIGAELQARLDALQQALPQASAEDLQARLQALEQTGPDLAGLAGRIDTLEASLAAAPAAADTDRRLDDLQKELGALAAKLAAQALGEGNATASDLALLDTLQARLAALEESRPDAASGAAVTGQLDALSARVDALEPLGAQSAGNQEQLAGLSGQLGGLAEQIQGLRERADAAQTELDTLGTRLTAGEAQIEAAADGREQGALLALVTSQIDGALGQARPFDAPLQGLAALAGDDATVREAVAALEPAAQGGVPGLAELRRSFEGVAGEIVHQAQAPAGQSLLDQATGNLMRLVSVRPVGADVAGDEPPARVARAEAALAAGDLAAAVAEIEALDGPAAAAAADWLAAAKARLAVTAALERLRSRATELLAQSG